MAEKFEEKTEQATPRRRQKAREKGETAKSKEITGVIPIWIFFLVLVFGYFMFMPFLQFFMASLERGFEVTLDKGSLVETVRTDIFQIALIVAPLFGLMLFVIAIVHFIQTGFLFSVVPLSPKLSRLNPIEGVKKIFSLNALFEAFKGIFKIIMLGLVAYLLIKSEVVNMLLLADMGIPSIAVFIHDQITMLVLASVVVLTIFAFLDFAYQRWQFDRNLRMTRHEVKEDYKEVEGDPLIRARIKSLQRDMARKRMMQDVPKADVVITNPTHLAVALKYDSSKMGAPVIVAKGANLISEKIKEIANKSGVPVFEDKPLAMALFKFDVGMEVPEALYKAVATILANVYKLKGRGNSYA